MPKTPKLAGRVPHPEALFPSQVVAANVRSLRALRGLSQDGLAEKMQHLQHEWSRATASEVERGRRNVTVDELASLAIALGVWGPGDLLDPERLGVALDVGMTGPLRKQTASAWARGVVRVHVIGEPGAEKYVFEDRLETLADPERMLEGLKLGSREPR
jgi:transcriptional regulator with XRE-family HTH domain